MRGCDFRCKNDEVNHNQVRKTWFRNIKEKGEIIIDPILDARSIKWTTIMKVRYIIKKKI